MKVTKRNGSEVEFDKSKIVRAITGANNEVEESYRLGETFIQKIADDVEFICKFTTPLTVEVIQEQVETQLMVEEAYEVAKAYIRYRYEHTLERNKQQALMKVVGEKLSATNVQNQNANVDEVSFGGRKGEAASAMMRQYALEHCISEMAKNNHLNNEVYIHDFDSYAVGMHNCLTIPFDDLLSKGFNTRQTDVRPAQSVSTAFQLVAVLYQLQSLQQFGGVASSHLDWTMVPYVRKSFLKHFRDGLRFIDGKELDYSFHDGLSIDEPDYQVFSSRAADYAMEMTRREVYQAVEGMYHNLNTLQSRSGNQLPFTSINYGTCTLPEGRMVTKALLDVAIRGIGKLHKTAIFPCCIFQCMRGVNQAPGDPNYDLFRLALKCTSLRLYPNYANVDWSGNAGYDRSDPRTYFATMGCRTANGFDINGLGQLKDGRGNICPVTIILPTLAMEAKSSMAEMEEPTTDNPQMVERFMEILDTKIGEAKEMLLERYAWICAQPAESAKFMYENGLMAGYDGKTTESALKHGTLALGQLGLAEALQILIGCNHTTDKGMQLAKRIEQLFKERCAEFKKAYKLNFGVYYSPSENLCYTAMKKFRQKYGVIKNVSDHNFFTNSMHVPVWEKIGVFRKIDIESQLTGYSSAGCITYVELESSVKHNIDAMETIVRYAMEHDIPYFAINVPNDTCLDCGFTDEFDDTCPQCGSHRINHLRRVTGYLTGDYKTAFNLGKQREVEARVKHSQNGERYEFQRN